MLHVCARRPFRVHVKTLTGTTIVLENVDDSYKVIDIKSMIAEQSGIPTHQQRLITAGTQMEDGRTVAEYGVQDQDPVVMHLVLRLRGGGDGLGLCAPSQFIDVSNESALVKRKWSTQGMVYALREGAQLWDVQPSGIWSFIIICFRASICLQARIRGALNAATESSLRNLRSITAFIRFVA